MAFSYLPAIFAMLATTTVAFATEDAGFDAGEIKNYNQDFTEDKFDNTGNTDFGSLLDIIQKQEDLIHKQEVLIMNMDRKLQDHDNSIKELQSTMTTYVKKSENYHVKSNGTSNNQGQLLDNRIDTGGKLTKRLLTPSATSGVAFSVYLSHEVDHMTVGTKIIFDRVYTNDGNAYDTHTGIFSVPRSGVYLLTYTIDCNLVDHAVEVELVINGASYGSAKAETFKDLHHVQSTKTVILHLAAGQIVWLQTYWVADSSLNSSNDNKYSTFSGVLLY